MKFVVVDVSQISRLMEGTFKRLGRGVLTVFAEELNR